jgi:polyisoprenoid-binding protein YceI
VSLLSTGSFQAGHSRFPGCDTTNEVGGHIEILPDGAVAPGAKLTVSLKNVKSDQSHRDEYVNAKVFEVDKYPDAVFLPTAIKAISTGGGHYGVTLSGSMTIHGVTKPMSFRGIATVDAKTMMVYGSTTSNFTFADFNLFKPKIGPLVAMEDKITLDLVFKFKRS